MDVAVQTHC